jgi:hypothetical protein
MPGSMCHWKREPCVVDATVRIVPEAKIASEPAAPTAWFGRLGLPVMRLGFEAGPLWQWLYPGMHGAGLPVVTRYVRDASKAMPVKTDRKDAHGIRPANAAWLVPSGTLQVAAGAGGAGTVDGAQTDAGQEP